MLYNVVHHHVHTLYSMWKLETFNGQRHLCFAATAAILAWLDSTACRTPTLTLLNTVLRFKLSVENERTDAGQDSEPFSRDQILKRVNRYPLSS